MEFIDNTRVVKSRAQRRKALCFILKGSNKNVSFPRTKSKIRCERQVSRQKISPKAEEKEIAPIGLQSIHGREGGKFEKRT